MYLNKIFYIVYVYVKYIFFFKIRNSDIIDFERKYSFKKLSYKINN